MNFKFGWSEIVSILTAAILLSSYYFGLHEDVALLKKDMQYMKSEWTDFKTAYWSKQGDYEKKFKRFEEKLIP